MKKSSFAAAAMMAIAQAYDPNVWETDLVSLKVDCVRSTAIDPEKDMQCMIEWLPKDDNSLR